MLCTGVQKDISYHMTYHGGAMVPWRGDVLQGVGMSKAAVVADNDTQFPFAEL